MSNDPNGLPDVYSLDGLPVSGYREWLRQRREAQSKKTLGERALDTFEELARRDVVAADELGPILEAACSPFFVAWDIGMHFLCRLAARHEVARETMRNVTRTGKAELRSRVIEFVHDRLPKEFCIELIRSGFTDKSKRVRQAAAARCQLFLLDEMLPELCHLATIECDPPTKFAFEYAIGIIRDGYFVYSRPDGSQAFVVRISDGCPGELLYPGPGWCMQANLDERGPKAVAEEIRRVSGRTRRPFRWNT